LNAVAPAYTCIASATTASTLKSCPCAQAFFHYFSPRRSFNPAKMPSGLHEQSPRILEDFGFPVIYQPGQRLADQGAFQMNGTLTL
jgi:hypothetical protein